MTIDANLYPNLPSWLTDFRPDQLTAVDEIMEHYQAGARVVVLEAPTGCLAADTMIGVNRAKKGSTSPIQDIVTKFNGGTINAGRGAGKPYGWDLSIPTYVQTAVEGVVRLGLLKSAWESGVKEVWELVTWKGRTIRATTTHPFLTPNGWVPLGQLHVGNEVLVRGKQAAGFDKKPKAQYLQRAELIHHPHATGANNAKRGTRYRVPLHRLVVEADMNGMALGTFIYALRYEGAEGFAFLDRETHVHHRDRDHRNNALANLEVHATNADHMREHDEFRAHVLQKIVTDRIRIKRFIGERPTYDLELVNEPHNFIANEFVVHNSGKTVIAEMVRRRLRAIPGTAKPTPRGIYSCTTKSLQHQFRKDFESAVLMGKRNYETEFGGDVVSCEDCMGPTCVWCESRDTCPYSNAVDTFNDHQLGVTNMAYLIGQLAQGDEQRRITYGRDLVVMDEADAIESILIDRAGLIVTERSMRDWRIDPPIKSAHKSTLQAWCVEAAGKARVYATTNAPKAKQDIELSRKIRRTRETATDLVRVSKELALDPDGWIRDYAEGSDRVKLQPVTVGGYGRRLLWDRFDARVLVMSASILSPDQWLEDVGLIGVEDAGDVEWGQVQAPMRFAVANRPVWYVPVVDMSRSGKGVAWDERVMTLTRNCRNTLDKFAGANTLVHTVSYALSRAVVEGIAVSHKNRMPCTNDGRIVWTYTSASDRDRAVAGFKDQGGVLVASSLERGIDLPGDLCRLQIVTKVPFPNLGDTRTAARMRASGGSRWYALQTARSLVQMTGRGVRGMDDHADTVIFDTQFGRWWTQWGKTLMPKYWRDAMQTVPANQFFR